MKKSITPATTDGFKPPPADAKR